MEGMMRIVCGFRCCPFFLLNMFYIALARAILLIFQVSDILSEDLGLAIANLKLLVNVVTW
jgi:hypothetical protein